MTELIASLVIGSGVCAMIYRLYLMITEGREKELETKQSVVVEQDKQKVEEDVKETKQSDDDFESAVDNFNKRNN
jgi:hypothetical protein